MRRHRILVGGMAVCAVLMILSAFLPIVKQLTIHVTSVGGTVGVEYNKLTTLTIGKPQWEMVPIMWRSGYVKKLVHSLMIGLTFLGGLRTGILLLENREKLKRLYNPRMQPTPYSRG